ncbi:hypothetical protein ACFV0R_18540 [Streptomyces sp. NPDC059578]|uniref:hypothetical protein n=1 Tax=Streptomyces sp. NPDC059578 TaxID=3346874 RepID=UPI0036960560
MTEGVLSLVELDRVAWAELECMGGPATEVPVRLRALTSADAGHRRRAWEWLGTHLYHQGTVYPAAAHAVPFLLGLLAEGGTPDRERTLGYLTRLVESPSEDGATPPADGPPGDDSARRAVAAGARAVLPHLDAADPSTAGAAAELLAWLPELASVSLPGLRRLCARRLPGRERSTALIALGALAGAAGTRSDPAMLEQLLGDRADPDRWAAAVALCRITVPDQPPAAVAAMVAELAAVNVDPQGYERVWRTRFHDNHVAGLLAATLRHLPQERGESTRDLVARRLGETESTPDEVAAVASGLVVDALGDESTVAPGVLTPWQRAVLGALPGADPAWASGELGPWLTSAYGLPGTGEALAAWLARSA